MPLKKMKILEAHNGLGAKMIEKSRLDGIWVSSLTHSASHGLPDNELVPLKERVELVEEIRRITTKPILVDIDTGGDMRHLPYYIRWFREAGAWAVVIEDKKYPKENSLLEDLKLAQTKSLKKIGREERYMKRYIDYL